MTVNLQEDQKLLLLKQLDETIKRLEKELQESKEIRQAVLNDIGKDENSKKQHANQKKLPRLAPGVAKKWVREALKSAESLSISMIMDYTEKTKGRRLRDAPIRRALSQLTDEGEVKRNEDGSWSEIRHNSLVRMGATKKDDSF